MMPAMRFFLAFSTSLTVHFIPTAADRQLFWTQVILVFYTGYCFILYSVNWRPITLLQPNTFRAWWSDVAVYLLLIVLSNGAQSVFFPGLFFFIFVAAFQVEYPWGVGLTTVALALVVSVEPANWKLSYSHISPIYLLLLLGCMLAYCRGYEHKLRRRLLLLKEITSFSNPRFGVDRTINSILEHLREFYNADSAWLVMAEFPSTRYNLYHAHRDRANAAKRPRAIEAGSLLLSIPANQAIVYSRKRHGWWAFGTRHLGYEVPSWKRITVDRGQLERVATSLKVRSFLSTPLSYSSNLPGRIYLLCERSRFRETDLDFLSQVVGHVLPLLDNVRLVDRLASDAAEEERRRIARDIHDSIIQPYVGIQLGLIGVQSKLAAPSAAVEHDIAKLIGLTENGIADLRNYVSGLQGNSGKDQGSLLPAVKRFAQKFSEATGLSIEIQSNGEIKINDRLAAEVFQMVAEAFSNVRRHTVAERVTTNLSCTDCRLVVRIENDRAEELVSRTFTPRSITARALALGGQARVESRGSGTTAVVIEIPL
jgi:signal transduction histidine kinase